MSDWAIHPFRTLSLPSPQARCQHGDQTRTTRRGHRMRCLTATLVLWLCISLAASAQQAGKAPLVGVLLINTAANPEPVVPLFRNALAGLGYVEDRNLRLDFRFAEGHPDRFPALAAALVGDKANVIAALGDARRTTGHTNDPDRRDRRRPRRRRADPEQCQTRRQHHRD